MNIDDEYAAIVARDGVSLESLGLSESGLSRGDCATAIALLRRLGRPILGGDVYHSSAGRVIPSYANWHVERRHDEQRLEFLERGWSQAEAYVRDYEAGPGQVPLFVLVVSSDPIE